MEHQAPEQRSDGPEPDDQRVSLILARARREVAMRDLITFVAARAWSAVSALGSVFVGLFGDRPAGNGNDREPADREEK